MDLLRTAEALAAVALVVAEVRQTVGAPKDLELRVAGVRSRHP